MVWMLDIIGDSKTQTASEKIELETVRIYIEPKSYLDILVQHIHGWNFSLPPLWMGAATERKGTIVNDMR